jgi:putative hydrolase of the HAD superfamily
MFEKKQVFIDLDDTLIDDNYKFEMTSCDCAKVIMQAFETRAPAIDAIIEKFRTIDNARLSSIAPDDRFRPARTLGSWHQTYDDLCAEHGRSPKRSTHMLLEGYVLQNFEPPYYVIPDVFDVLNELSRFGKYELRLLSAGDPVIQDNKIEGTGLKKYFASMHFLTDGEKGSALERAAGEFGAKNMWMIGNSIGSDINPALKLGVNAIYIPRGSWHAWHAEPFNTSYVELGSIRMVPDTLEKWPAA